MKKMIFSLALLTLTASTYASDYDDYVFFGDSLTDTGNNGCYTNQVNFGSSAGCGTWANYLHYAKFGTQALSSNQGGEDYAVSGSTSNDMLNQVHQYLQRHGGQADPNTYYFILTGANDARIKGTPIGNQLGQDLNAIEKDYNSQNFTQLVTDAKSMGSLLAQVFFGFGPWLENPGGPIYNQVEAIKELYAAKAKHVMVIDQQTPNNVPFMQPYFAQLASLRKTCNTLPSQDLQGVCNTAVSAATVAPDGFARIYNGTLEADLHTDLAASSIVSIYSMNGLYQNLISSGKFKPCVNNSGDDSNDCIYWNSDGHPTRKAHEIMADAIQAVINNQGVGSTEV